MLNQQFEVFLANLFCIYIDEINSQNTKYQYVSSNPEQSLKLYNGFKSLGFKTLKVNDSMVNYVESCGGQKIIVMLHHLGEQDANSSHEDYIASVRDAINDIENAILFIINNSSLETLTTTFTDTCAAGGVYASENVSKALSNLGYKHKEKLIYESLIAISQKTIDEENLSIFGFEKLYKSLHCEKIDIKEHGFFPEPRLSDINNETQLRKELYKNKILSMTINAIVNDFSDDSSELQKKLEEIGLGERFIKENFIKNKLAYKNETFSNIEDEIEKNKLRKLEVRSIEINSNVLNTWRDLNNNSPSNGQISLISEVNSNEVELKIKMGRGEPQLRNEQVTVDGDISLDKITINTINTDNHSILNVKLPFIGSPLFFQIRLKRSSSRESYKFNVCIVKSDVFYLKNYLEYLEVEIKRNKGKLILSNVPDMMLIDARKNREHIFNVKDKTVDFDELKSISFKEIKELDYHGDVKFVSGSSQLQISIVGPKLVESIKLPSLFDTQRSMSIFSADSVPKYKPNTSRVVIGGRERDLSPQAKELCTIEHSLINDETLYFDDENNLKISIIEISEEFPEVSASYSELYHWLSRNETLLSITNWPDSLTEIIEKLLFFVERELESIPQGALNTRSRLLISLGSIKRNGSEFLTPFHPLCLSYALQFSKLRKKDEINSFSFIPPTTVDKFNASGLIPILFDNKSTFLRAKPLSHNKFWIEIGENGEKDNHYVSKLVYEKIVDFVGCFEMLFENSFDTPIIINSINNKNNSDVFRGVLSYFKKTSQKRKTIQINIYNEVFYNTDFDLLSEYNNIHKLRELIRTNTAEKEADLDDLIYKLRNGITIYKITDFTEYRYAHISFFTNNEEVVMRTNNVNESKSGILCKGLLSGESSYLENDVFYTGFGLKNVDVDNYVLKLASLYNQLLLPYRDNSAKFIKNSVPVLAVQDSFRSKLSKVYSTSIWTCIIDPKVTLDFFDTKETILIHYTDQYTNSVSYDAVTVSSRIGIYKDLLNSHSNELISSFNALNGQWLLNIIKDSGEKRSESLKNQIKEKKGIVAAYKFVSSLLLPSDLTWIPLSVGEMLRVTGNLGLQIKDHDFSARLHNKSKGALSDDILFVGIKDRQLVLLPLEVKSRKSGTDFTKAIKQSKALSVHMKELLQPNTFKGRVYRSLFVQQLFTQIEKFELYNVFPKNYFSLLHDRCDHLLQGDYSICDLINYPEGVVLAVNEGMERSRIEISLDEDLSVMKVRLPQGFVKTLHEESIENLSIKFRDSQAYPELSRLKLFEGEFENYSALESEATSDAENEEENYSQRNSSSNSNGFNDIVFYKTNFKYDPKFEIIVEKAIKILNRDINHADIISLTELDFQKENKLSSKDLILFYTFKKFILEENH
ncbi:DNA phosphorothioation-dependent restriction protein DptH, partial [Pantoea agglomerans]|uniref:DNA phosphorothioation-dependent restriction protein DptH n=1 Tax=Enterobacter agglomerans TaxID=549 RepID=UPI0015FC1FA2